MKKQAERRWPWVLCACVTVLAMLCIAYREPIRMIWYSIVDPQNRLDVSDPWEEGKVYRDVRYSDISESDYLNLYVPNADALVPLIVLIHGGGFVSNDCESRQAQLFYQYFRNHGYACATVNYRLAQEAVFPAAVEDVKCAIRFLRANAEVYGYDGGRIAVWGESAGGYLAVMAAVTTEDEFKTLPFTGEDQLSEKVSAKVDFLIDYYGAVELESKAERVAAFRALGVPSFVMDIANSWLNDAIKDIPWAETCEDAWMGKPFSEMTEAERQAASPLYYAEENMQMSSGLEALILHGDADITVPVTQSKRLYDLLSERLGAEHVTLQIIRNAKHADEDMYSDMCLGTVREWLDERL